MSLGPRGPLLLQDNNFLENMAHFDRERIPERVVHAKGAGAFGYFECTHDVTEFTKLSPFSKIGKKTDISARFSTVGMLKILYCFLNHTVWNECFDKRTKTFFSPTNSTFFPFSLMFHQTSIFFNLLSDANNLC